MFSTMISSIHLLPHFLYHSVFYSSAHYLPVYCDIPGLSYITNPPGAPILSLQHTFNGNLPVPVCEICAALKCTCLV